MSQAFYKRVREDNKKVSNDENYLKHENYEDDKKGKVRRKKKQLYTVKNQLLEGK